MTEGPKSDLWPLKGSGHFVTSSNVRLCREFCRLAFISGVCPKSRRRENSQEKPWIYRWRQRLSWPEPRETDRSRQVRRTTTTLLRYTNRFKFNEYYIWSTELELWNIDTCICIFNIYLRLLSECFYYISIISRFFKIFI